MKSASRGGSLLSGAKDLSRRLPAVLTPSFPFPHTSHTYIGQPRRPESLKSHLSTPSSAYSPRKMHTTSDKKTTKGASIPGFASLSDQVFVRDGSPDATPAENDPRAILIYGWGDGLPKHVAKYSEGYRRLFPASKQVVVLGPIPKAMFSDLAKRSADMAPVLDCLGDLMGEREKDGGDSISCNTAPILVHAMSNTGAVNYASTLSAHCDAYSRPFPHRLLVLDSTPGNPYPNMSTMSRWSRAMTLGTAAWFPWPFAVTQAMWFVVLAVNVGWGWLAGREPSGQFALKAVDNETYETKEAKRLYLYSKEDDLISFEDIEGYAAASRTEGYDSRTELFEGSGHVGHMRMHPEKYWAAVAEAWTWAQTDGETGRETK